MTPSFPKYEDDRIFVLLSPSETYTALLLVLENSFVTGNVTRLKYNSEVIYLKHFETQRDGKPVQCVRAVHRGKEIYARYGKNGTTESFASVSSVDLCKIISEIFVRT